MKAISKLIQFQTNHRKKPRLVSFEYFLWSLDHIAEHKARCWISRVSRDRKRKANHSIHITCDFNNTTYTTCSIWQVGDGHIREIAQVGTVAHRTFLGGRQIADHDRYKEICEQITQ